MHKAVRLDPATSYAFRVAAGNIMGDGPFGEASTVRTSLAPPLAPPPPQLSAVLQDESLTRASLSVSWEPPQRDAAHAECATYEVQVRQRS